MRKNKIQSWWKKLKTWKKGGLILASIYLVVTGILVLMGLFYKEQLLEIVRVVDSSPLNMMLDIKATNPLFLIFGTSYYAVLGIFFGMIYQHKNKITILIQKNKMGATIGATLGLIVGILGYPINLLFFLISNTLFMPFFIWLLHLFKCGGEDCLFYGMIVLGIILALLGTYLGALIQKGFKK